MGALVVEREQRIEQVVVMRLLGERRARGLDFGQTNAFSRIVYVLVGLAAVTELVRLPALARDGAAHTAHSH